MLIISWRSLIFNITSIPQILFNEETKVLKTSIHTGKASDLTKDLKIMKKSLLLKVPCGTVGESHAAAVGPRWAGSKQHSITCLCVQSVCLSWILFVNCCIYIRAFHVAPVVKNPLANARDIETWFQSLVREDPLEEGMATHSSILAWRISWTEELGRLQSIGSQRSDMTEWLSSLIHIYI